MTLRQKQRNYLLKTFRPDKFFTHSKKVELLKEELDAITMKYKKLQNELKKLKEENCLDSKNVTRYIYKSVDDFTVPKISKLIRRKYFGSQAISLLFTTRLSLGTITRLKDFCFADQYKITEFMTAAVEMLIDALEKEKLE